MGLIVGEELIHLIDKGVISADPKYVNGSSIDVHLGDEILIESSSNPMPVSLISKQLPCMVKLHLSQLPNQRMTLYPGHFCLAHTVERFNLPDYISAEFKLRSSVARAGLNHALAGWCDPGWSGSQLTMELSNSLMHHPIYLEAGLRIGQMVFYSHAKVPSALSYREKGRYNDRDGVSREAV